MARQIVQHFSFETIQILIDSLIILYYRSYIPTYPIFLFLIRILNANCLVLNLGQLTDRLIYLWNRPCPFQFQFGAPSSDSFEYQNWFYRSSLITLIILRAHFFILWHVFPACFIKCCCRSLNYLCISLQTPVKSSRTAIDCWHTFNFMVIFILQQFVY